MTTNTVTGRVTATGATFTMKVAEAALLEGPHGGSHVGLHTRHDESTSNAASAAGGNLRRRATTSASYRRHATERLHRDDIERREYPGGVPEQRSDQDLKVTGTGQYDIFTISTHSTRRRPARSPPRGGVRPDSRRFSSRPTRGCTTARRQAADIQRLPRGQAYVIDLSRTGVIYRIGAPGSRIDAARVKVHTSGGDVALESWLAGALSSSAFARWKESGQVRIGRSERLLSHQPGRPLRTRVMEPAVTAKGDADCDTMFSSGLCGDLDGLHRTECGVLLPQADRERSVTTDNGQNTSPRTR